MQLKVQYGIDWEELNDVPKRRYFDLSVDETYSHFRNKSHVTVEACIRYGKMIVPSFTALGMNFYKLIFRWLATDEAETSGPTTLEVETPSGYGFVQSDANELVIKNNYTFIRDVFIGRSKIIWVFDRVIPLLA